MRLRRFGFASCSSALYDDRVRRFLPLLLALTACARPATPTAQSTAPAPSVPLDDAFDIVASLSTEVGPRLAGSAGDANAVAWATRTMTRLGLTGVRTEAVQVPVWRRGEERATLVETNTSVAVTALGGSAATPSSGVSAKVARVTSLDAVKDAADGAFAGRIVFFDVPTPRTKDGHGYGNGVLVRVLGPALAARKGAVAVVVRSIGTDDGDAPHTGFVKDPDADAGVAPVPSAALSSLASGTLAAALAQNPNLTLRLLLTPSKGADATSANVLGEVPGRTSEVVLLAAHLDSWDLARGAVDDGAGVAIALDAARAIQRRGIPRRTVRVVLFAAEENSGAGARAYAAAHAAEPHAVATEADLGCGAPYEVRWLSDSAHGAMLAPLGASLAAVGVVVSTEGAEGGSDVQPLRLLGVPLMDVRQDASLYFDVHHSKNDTLAAVDRSTLQRAADVMATVAWYLANVEGELGRVPTEQRTRR